MNNTNSPNSNDLNQVKLNQQSNPSPNQPVAAKPTPAQPTPVPVPPPQNAPPQNTSPSVGVGKPNIGVELEEKNESKKSDDTITLSSSEVSIPRTEDKKAPETKKPITNPEPPKNDDAETSEVAIKNMPPNFKEEPKTATDPVLMPTNTPGSNQAPLNTELPKPPEKASTAEEQNIPIKTYDTDKTTDHTQAPVPTPIPPSTTNTTTPSGPAINTTIPPQQPPSQPPIKASSGGPAATITVLAILALILGSSGGFFGFRYWDKIQISASEENLESPTAYSTTVIKNGLKSYSNDLYKFSLYYPEDWVPNTENKNAEAITFASNAESLSGGTPTGYRIEITLENSAGKTLKNFVDSKAAALNEQGEIIEIMINEQAAYQQAQTNIQPIVVTFIERSDKIMIITYSAATDQLTKGADIYNNLIDSIKLN